jgi:ABC-type multidrug transport system fused ATPase/permease subunit
MIHGGASWLPAPLTPGDLVAYILFMNIILMPIRLIVELYSMALRAMAGAERIFEILDTEPDIQNVPNPFPAGNLDGTIRFDDVSFRYDTEGPDVLKAFSLTIRSGETMALVGKTGAGKTTIASLVGRFYEPSRGRITIDDRDIRTYELDSLHQSMAIVPQEGFLFTGTVLDNLLLRAPDRTRDEVEAVARKLGTHDAILSLPNGYDTLILEGGRSISEGQRQLISITRALLAAPRILILDEPTSALDVHTESILQEALEQLVKGRTTLIVAHRISTIRKADRIVVIDEGTIMEIGTHEELMQKGGRYRRFVQESETTEGMVT